MQGLRIALVQLGLAAAAGNLVLMATLLFGAQDRAAAVVTLFLLLAIFPWSLGVALQSVPEILAAYEPLLDNATLALFWIPPTALHVACRWTHHHDCRLSRGFLIFTYVAGAFAFLAQWAGMLPLGPTADHGWGVMRGGDRAWLAFTLHALLTLTCLTVAGFWCWSRLRSDAPAPQKLGARVWLLSAVVFGTAAMSNYLVVFGVPVVPAGTLGNVLFLCVVGFFVARHGFLHVRSEIRRVAAAVTLAVLFIWVLTTVWMTVTSPPLLSAQWVVLELATAGVGGAAIVGYGIFLVGGDALRQRRDAAPREPDGPAVHWIDSHKLRAATNPREASELVVETVRKLSPIRSAAVYRRPLGVKLFRLDAMTGPRLFPRYATRAQLASGFAYAGDLQAAGGLSRHAFEECTGPRPAWPEITLASSTQAPTAGTVAALRAWPVPRLGQFEGYFVVETADCPVSSLDDAAMVAIGVALAALWHNLELRGRGVQLPDNEFASLHSQTLEQDVPSETPLTDLGVEVALGLANEGPRRSADENPALQAIVGRSAPLMESLDVLRKAAALDLPVLLVGETGTGKELFARALHALSPRRHAPFHAINCATIPLELAENELFGHERGAYTGATQAHTGWLEKLTGGVLFLDEVAEMPLVLQAKFLRVMEQGEVTPLGSTDTRHVDLRVVAATNRSLEEMVCEQSFREDLYHRLCGIVIRLPPLRERLEDIPLLVEHFLRQIGMAPIPWPEEAMRLMMQYSWPGNVRELRSVVLSVTGLCKTGRVSVEMVESALRNRLLSRPHNLRRAGPEHGFRVNLAHSLSQGVRAYKVAHVKAALQASGGDGTNAARMLGLTKSNFNRLLRSLGLPAEPQKPRSPTPPYGRKHETN